jgi:hypothetical protein
MGRRYKYWESSDVPKLDLLTTRGMGRARSVGRTVGKSIAQWRGGFADWYRDRSPTHGMPGMKGIHAHFEASTAEELRLLLPDDTSIDPDRRRWGKAIALRRQLEVGELIRPTSSERLNAGELLTLFTRCGIKDDESRISVCTEIGLGIPFTHDDVLRRPLSFYGDSEHINGLFGAVEGVGRDFDVDSLMRDERFNVAAAELGARMLLASRRMMGLPEEFQAVIRRIEQFDVAEALNKIKPGTVESLTREFKGMLFKHLGVCEGVDLHEESVAAIRLGPDTPLEAVGSQCAKVLPKSLYFLSVNLIISHEGVSVHIYPSNERRPYLDNKEAKAVSAGNDMINNIEGEIASVSRGWTLMTNHNGRFESILAPHPSVESLFKMY